MGGGQYIEVTDESVVWQGRFLGSHEIRDCEVEFFEITEEHSVRVRLKNGRKLYVPNIGDQQELIRHLFKNGRSATT